MSEFASKMWGDISFGKKSDPINPPEEKKEEPKQDEDDPKPIDKVDDKAPDSEEDDPKGNSKEEDDPVEDPKVDTTEKKGDDEEDSKGDEEDEYKFTQDDVDKAFTMLDDEGVLDIPEDAEFDEGAKGLADAIATTVQNKLRKEIEKIPPVVQELYAHVMSGEDASSFKITTNATSWKDATLETEAQQQGALMAHLRLQGYSAEEAQDEVDEVTSAGRLEAKARRSIGVLVKTEKAQEEAAARDKAKADKEANDRAKAERAEMEKLIDDSSEIAGFVLDDKRKKAFKNYIYKVDPRTGKTQMQKNLSNADRINRIAFMDFLDFNKEDFTKAVTSEVSKKNKKKMSRYTSKSVKGANASQSVKTKSDARKGPIKFHSIFGAGDDE